MRPTDSTDELRDAIRKLEEFSRQNVEISSTPLQKTISLVRSMIFDAFSEKDAKKNFVFYEQQEVLHAIEVVNRERLLIQKLKLGSCAEQRLADSFTKAIEGYNASLERHRKLQPSKNHGIAKFFLKKSEQEVFRELPKIDLPQQCRVHYHYPASDHTEEMNRKISSLQLSVHLSRQSTELFQMKALVLLERYGIASNLEARNIVKTSPIFTALEGESTSQCTLSQTLELFPGQTVIVKGMSELDPKTQIISKLFPDSFCLSLESTQTGFPHPSQRAGWTFANQLVPECPQRIDLLPKLASFYQRKKQVVLDLYPHGSLICKAKKLLKLKKQAFAVNQKEWIALHEELAKAFVRAAPPDLVNNLTNESISRYYRELHQHRMPFEFLVHTHQTILDNFIALPHNRLLEAIIKGDPLELSRKNSVLSFETSNIILNNEIDAAYDRLSRQKQRATSSLEQSKWDYIIRIGQLLGISSKRIILQYLSEDVVCTPPKLNDFERRIQTSAYQHVEDFLTELAWEDNHDNFHDLKAMQKHLKQQIEWDIDQFSTSTHFESNLAEELAEYFCKRYQTVCSV
jgi:hypothetical protein